MRRWGWLNPAGEVQDIHYESPTAAIAAMNERTNMDLEHTYALGFRLAILEVTVRVVAELKVEERCLVN